MAEFTARPRRMLITTGATAPFRELCQAALDVKFLAHLHKHTFTHLTLQMGDTLSEFQKLVPEDTKGVKINAFGFKSRGLHKDMMYVQARDEEDYDIGVVITHCGSGTILDIMRLGLPMIVVPNPNLLHNHQQELADELDRLGYCTQSTVGELAQALDNCLALKKPRDDRDEKRTQEARSKLNRLVDDQVRYEEDVTLMEG
ncbi:glycosyl transferase [Bisporella sp. PMI_857]|nr:glycosyl transferase [Bisporella sp. PMI_857]